MIQPMSLISFGINSQNNNTNYTINNTDYAETYTGEIIVKADQSFRLYENDPYGIKTRPIILKDGINANQYGRGYYSFNVGANLQCEIEIAELVHSFTFTGTVYCFETFEFFLSSS